MPDERIETAVTPRPGDLTVARVGVHVARTRPDKLALHDGARKISYGQLDSDVEAIASGLVAAGVAKGDIVAAYLPNCIDYVEIVLAVARAGAVFSPINPRFKSYEITMLLKSGRPRVVFTTGDKVAMVADAAVQAGLDQVQIVTTGRAAEASPRACALDRFMDVIRRPLPTVDEDDCFSLMFTSGTTGSPKGAFGTHRARMIWVLNAAIQYGLNEDDVYLGTMPQVHSAGLTLTLIHLYVGATVRIMERFDPVAFLDTVEREQITSSLSVPTMLAMILEAFDQGGRHHDLSSLRRVLTCGSPLPLATKKRVIESISSELYDYYGSTESNSMSVLKPRDQLRKPNSVGQPFTNVEIMIAAADGKPRPAGEIGEIWCANPSVMKCYLNQPEETAAAFTGRWFHTGDLGYLDDENYLHIVGRLKDVIISGGVNIYPAEIENVLLLHPAIFDCAVVGVDDAKWGQAVKAFVVPRQGASIDLAEVQQHCRQRLADYKTPRHLEVIAEIPKNIAGKTIKSALRAQRRTEHAV
jgi:acyl-CoA synthetase (AMP-forming)/AMP-acid ligase II